MDRTTCVDKLFLLHSPETLALGQEVYDELTALAVLLGDVGKLNIAHVVEQRMKNPTGKGVIPVGYVSIQDNNIAHNRGWNADGARQLMRSFINGAGPLVPDAMFYSARGWSPDKEGFIWGLSSGSALEVIDAYRKKEFQNPQYLRISGNFARTKTPVNVDIGIVRPTLGTPRSN